jgi:hypothetical protein
MQFFFEEFIDIVNTRRFASRRSVLYVACSSLPLTKEHPVVKVGNERSSCISVVICEVSRSTSAINGHHVKLSRQAKPPTRTYTGLFEMIVGVLTTCHTQYT